MTESIYARAARVFGVPSQQSVVAEEIAELIALLAREQRGNRTVHAAALASEFADALIVLEGAEVYGHSDLSYRMAVVLRQALGWPGDGPMSRTLLRGYLHVCRPDLVGAIDAEREAKLRRLAAVLDQAEARVALEWDRP